MILRVSKSTGACVRRVCAVLDLPRSSFYHAAKPSASRLADEALGVLIERIFHAHRRRYGYRRILRQLADEGHVASPARVRRIMAARRLRAIAPKTFTPKTSDGRADCPSPNLIENTPLPTRPNAVWAGDITFIPTASGWLYLAVVIDLCSRKIIGWALSDHLRSSLVIDAFAQALGSRQKTSAPIFHSDRGSQYGSRAFRQLLKQHAFRQSMSARANPYHNAWTESFIGTLKSEMLQGGRFIDPSDAQTELFAYIHSYYNTVRKHSSLDYLSPAQFEANFNSTN